MTLEGDAPFGGRPLGLGVDSFGVASLRGLPLGLGDAVVDFAGGSEAAFFGDGDFAEADAVFLPRGDALFGAGDFVFAAAAFFALGGSSSAAASGAFFPTADFLKAFAIFLKVEVFAGAAFFNGVAFVAGEAFFAGEAFLATFAVFSASAFLVDTTGFLGDRRTGGSGVDAAFALPVALPFLGEGLVFAFAMMGKKR